MKRISETQYNNRCRRKLNHDFISQQLDNEFKSLPDCRCEELQKQVEELQALGDKIVNKYKQLETESGIDYTMAEDDLNRLINEWKGR